MNEGITAAACVSVCVCVCVCVRKLNGHICVIDKAQGLRKADKLNTCVQEHAIILFSR